MSANSPSTSPGKTSSSPRWGRKVLDLLRRLPPQSHQELDEYFRSPLLGNSPQFRQLLQFLFEDVIAKGLDAFTPDELHAALFPQRRYESSRDPYIRLRLSQFHEQVMDFIAFREFRQDEMAKGQQFLNAVERYGWEDLLEKSLDRTLRRIDDTVSAASTQQRLAARLIHTGLLNEKGEPGQDTGIRHVLAELDTYYVIQKLKFACGELNHRLFSGQTLELKGLDYVQELAEQPEFAAVPVVRAYLFASRMLEAEIAGQASAQAHYQALLAMFTAPAPFAPDESRDLFTCLQNYIVLQYHRGHAAYLADLKQLYEQMLSNGQLEIRGKLSSMVLKNIVQLFCRSGNSDWAESIVELYRQRVSKDPLELAYHFNSAVIAFYRQDYPLVLKLLYHRIGKFEISAIEIAARIFVCRSLWHSQDWDWLLSSVQVFLKYLKRHRSAIGESNYQLYFPYAKYLKQAATAASARPSQVAKKLKACQLQLEESGHTATYAWLYGEVSQLLATVEQRPG